MRKEPNLRIDEYRIQRPGYESPPGMNYGCFLIGPLRIISSGSSEASEWEHVSISTERHTPTWEQMERVKQLFWGDRQTVLQFHPKATEYVNIHPHCLHLWRLVDDDHELPPQENI